MAVDFPSSPTPGQVYTQAGATWTFDGVKWVAQGTGTGIYLPLAGGVMTGDITLKGDPSAPLHPVTYRMVSNPNDNRIINGDFRIDQRNGGASSGAIGYTVDRWQYYSVQASKGTWGQNLNAVAAPSMFPYYFGFKSSSAYASLATDQFMIMQAIEADAVSDFAWGTPQAQPVTLSFWAYSSLTGTFSGALRNLTGNRSYPFAYSIPSANTWIKITITVAGDTVGPWVMSGNGGAVNLNFDLGTGSTYRAAANVWTSASYVSGATGSQNVVATNGATFYVTGVKLEIGSVATPFNRQSLAKSMADCQRYYQKLGGITAADILVQGYAVTAGAGGPVSSTIGFSTMRAAPTATAAGTWVFTNTSAIAGLFPSLNTLGFQLVGNVAGWVSANTSNTTTYISLSAEL